MRRLPADLLLILTIVFCPDPSLAINCAVTSVGFIPVNDLEAGFYHGRQGGLYGGGSNVRPAAHTTAGIQIAQTIQPLDTLGNLDMPNGRVVMISIGMSNTTIEFKQFMPKAQALPGRNPRLTLIDCAIGGQSADLIKSPTAAYWDSVLTRLRGRGSSPAQVQVVWLKEANKGPKGGFPAGTDSLQWNLGSILQILKSKLPNLKQCYFTSRIYAGYATTTLNPEPYSYESAFAIQALIMGQVNGVDSLNYDPAHGPVKAPWISWGPYLWADGTTPRSDGLTWNCSSYIDDGVHPNTAGALIVADSLLAFFRRDPAATPWFLRPTTAAGDPRPRLNLSVSPNPARGAIRCAFAAAQGQAWALEVLDVAGRRVRALASGTGEGGSLERAWDGQDDRGKPLPAGVYYVRATVGEGQETRRVVRLR